MLAELKTNKKIATATHNILAYRYYTIGTCSYYTLLITTENHECFLGTYLVKCLSNLQDLQIHTIAIMTFPLTLGCMMNVEECLFRTVMMMEKQLQGEGSFIYYRLINYCSNECVPVIAISPIINFRLWMSEM